MGEFTSAKLVTAVSNAGGLGILGCAYQSVNEIASQLLETRELTDRPFAVNHLLLALDEEAFSLTLKAKPAAISLAGGDPGGFVERAHDAGILVIHQIHTVRQAVEAAARGVDVIIAQGSEAGGHGWTVGAMILIPQVVDAVDPISVVASGSIADGRGLAAAIVLGASGVSIGTRFLASDEAPIEQDWKQMIVDSESEDAVKFGAWNEIMPPSTPGGYATSLRALRTKYIDYWQMHRDEAAHEAERLREEMLEAIADGKQHELVPGAGQSAGMIDEILPAGEIVRRIAAEAEHALAQSTAAISS
jgi:nitronate monooxygenase/enoyl-[acyl-carrier protein] reductase II